MYYGDGGYKEWKSGDYSENGVNGCSENVWKMAYQGVRQVSIFLNNIDMNKEFTAEEISDFKGQAHFLRAYFYWAMFFYYKYLATHYHLSKHSPAPTNDSYSLY